MAKQYIVSIDTHLSDMQQDNVVSSLENQGLKVVNKFLPLGSLVVNVDDDESLQQAKKIAGVLAIEEDSSMHTL